MNSAERRSITVVGASASGLNVCQELRRLGFRGGLTLIGDEEHLPYDRPPLSKQVLAGVWDADRIELAGRDQLAELEVVARLGVPATSLCAPQRAVRLADGSTVSGDSVVIATGCRPRRLRGPDELAGLHTLRSLDDARRLREELLPGRRVVIVGGGFLGMEVAATATGAGAEVVLISSASPMTGVVGDVVSRALVDLHLEHSVRLLIGARVTEVVASDGRAVGVRASDGRETPADAVVVAIGAEPATQWLADSGLIIQDGVVCDEGLRAAPGVYAVGDVVRWRDPRSRSLRRVEHRLHATESAAVAAANIEGQNLQYVPVTFWWSEQYATKIQMYGHASASTHLWQGDPDMGRAVFIYSEGETITGVLGWNSPRHLRAARQLLVSGTPLTDAGPTLLLTARAL